MARLMGGGTKRKRDERSAQASGVSQMGASRQRSTAYSTRDRTSKAQRSAAVRVVRMSGDPRTVILDQTGLSSSLFILICLSSYPPVYIQSMLQVEGQAEARSRPPTLFCTGCSDFITATLTHTGGVSMPFKAQVHSDSQVRSTKHPVPTQTFSMPGHPRTLQIESH